MTQCSLTFAQHRWQSQSLASHWNCQGSCRTPRCTVCAPGSLALELLGTATLLHQEFSFLWVMVAVSLRYASLVAREGKKPPQWELAVKGSSSHPRRCGFKNQDWQPATEATPVPALSSLAAGAELVQSACLGLAQACRPESDLRCGSGSSNSSSRLL